MSDRLAIRKLFNHQKPSPSEVANSTADAKPMMVAIQLWALALIVFTAAFTSTHSQADQLEAKAVFAGGCFWCMEPPFDKINGVTATISGYIGGRAETAHYKAVSRGRTKHYEAVQVTYNPKKVSYDELLTVFWRNVDPLDKRGQFCDKGEHYLSAIFVATEEERRLANASLAKLKNDERFSVNIATKVIDAQPFYAAEEYHQNYYQKNPFRYRYYRKGCGRDRRLAELWGK